MTAAVDESGMTELDRRILGAMLDHEVAVEDADEAWRRAEAAAHAAAGQDNAAPAGGPGADWGLVEALNARAAACDERAARAWSVVEELRKEEAG